jgi:hypothetical protein
LTGNTIANSRSLSPQCMPLKYTSDVPPVSISASTPRSLIRRRAFSMRPRRSSAVIGCA